LPVEAWKVKVALVWVVTGVDERIGRQRGGSEADVVVQVAL
jgi:hypothetical protein